MDLDDKVTNIYDYNQALIVFHMSVRMNAELTMDRMKDRFLFDNNTNNVLAYHFDRIQCGILD